MEWLPNQNSYWLSPTFQEEEIISKIEKKNWEQYIQVVSSDMKVNTVMWTVKNWQREGVDFWIKIYVTVSKLRTCTCITDEQKYIFKNQAIWKSHMWTKKGLYNKPDKSSDWK